MAPSVTTRTTLSGAVRVHGAAPPPVVTASGARYSDGKVTVWNQGREDVQSAMGDQNFTEDFNDLFHTRPLNTFLIKISYWLTPLAN